MNVKPLLIALAVVLAVPNFIPVDINEQLSYNKKERFHPVLASINSIDKLEKYVDNEAAFQNIAMNSPEYAQLLSYFISCRFYHGFSHWKMNENWIAAVGEKITGIGLSCKVQPEDIMKNLDAACSQQALVMMEILKRKKIDYRKVGFPHHYAIEIKSAAKWYYFDPNMEPTMNLKQRIHESWNGNNDILKNYYDSSKHANLAYQFGNGVKAIFGPVNEIPAQHLRFFQSSTAVLSKILWCFPLIFLFAKSRKRNKKMHMVKPINNNPSYQPNLNPVFSA
ncbi:hypothetical protein BH11BAC4_BH11BAC4_05220 [soil metagenome]